MTIKRSAVPGLALVTVASLAVAGCGSSSSGGSPSSNPSTSTSSAPHLHGTSFSILGQWTGEEQAAFQSVVDAFDKATGAKGKYSAASGGDEATVLGTKVNGGNPPDVAILSLPGAIAQYGNAGKLQAVSAAGKTAVAQNFASEWAQLATVKGTLYGVPVDASNKSTVWYNTKLFADAGLSSTPTTWPELISDAKTLGDSGVSVPFSVGGGDGWTLTDWFENAYLRTAGLQKYDELTHHQIKWTDPSVATALNALKQIWGDKSIVGSPSNAAKVPFTSSVDNVFKAKPTSAMVYEASFVATTITGDKDPAKVGTDAKFFPFPSIGDSGSVLEAAGDFAVAFTKNPAVQDFLTYLASPQAAQLLVSYHGSGFLSANQNLSDTAYPDPTSADLAKQIVSVGPDFRFDMSDQAPAAFGGTPNKGEWADLQTFLKNGNVAAAQRQLEKDANAAKGW
ncbi:MAG TPA: extracellular solute-binding protein [Mycobacteriales bacterium]|nr:extracellular solute-binding protein [Mycobacteriales bacterium]